MIETREIEIDGATYSVTQLPARRALRLQAKLMKLLGPAVSEIFIASAKNADTEDSSIPKALKLLFDQLDEANFDILVMELLQGCRKNNMELRAEIVDLEFAGKLNTLFMLLKFILEVNYGDFFQDGGIIKLLQKTE